MFLFISPGLLNIPITFNHKTQYHSIISFVFIEIFMNKLSNKKWQQQISELNKHTRIFNDWQGGVYCIQLSNIFKDYSTPTNNEKCTKKGCIFHSSFLLLHTPTIASFQLRVAFLVVRVSGERDLFVEEYWINSRPGFWKSFASPFYLVSLFWSYSPIWCQWWLMAHRVLGIWMLLICSLLPAPSPPFSLTFNIALSVLVISCTLWTSY